MLAQIKVFKIDELEEKYKIRALDKMREFEVMDFDHIWAQYHREELENILSILGFHEIKTQYSGFYSQGDGASFSAKIDGKDLKKCSSESPEFAQICKNFPELAKLARKLEIPEIEGFLIISTSGHYCHEKSMSVSIELDEWREDVTEEMEKVSQEILKLCRDLAKWYYDNMEKEYIFRTSDEYLIQECKEREILFDKTGRRINHLIEG